MDAASHDARVRAAAFQYLEQQTRLHGEVLPHSVLIRGFSFDGKRVPLLGPQGIFKPAVLPDVPLSLTTAPPRRGGDRPYDDTIGVDGFLRYRYRGGDPQHRDNVGLRLAYHRRTPLVYFHGVVKGEYVPTWPAMVIGDDPGALTFTVAIEDRALLGAELAEQAEPEAHGRRAYVTRVTLTRVHQQSFRRRVLRAYRERCAICRLRHSELLEAAHILPDGHPRGEPVVPNGLSLCRLHHAAFDRHILGVRPDLTVELRVDILREVDGPMLRYGLQGFQDARLHVPRPAQLRPDPDFLEERYELFKQAG